MAAEAPAPAPAPAGPLDDGDGDVGMRAAPGQEVCAVKGLGAALSGGVMGGIFGLGSGLLKREGLRGALKEGGSSAKTFAIMSSVHTVVNCYMKKLRKKEDAINAGIAGCATGLALGYGGTPQGMLQSCLGFGAFSYIFDYINPPAAASQSLPQSCSSHRRKSQRLLRLPRSFHLPVLPPFTLPFSIPVINEQQWVPGWHLQNQIDLRHRR
eukprot:SM000037S13528  [mRNA]  locus=s37:459103:460670:- [translate_table: standard]